MRAHTLKVGDVRCVHEECKKGKECTMWRRQCESSKPTADARTKVGHVGREA
jgi:hypothetical protein